MFIPMPTRSSSGTASDGGWGKLVRMSRGFRAALAALPFALLGGGCGSGGAAKPDGGGSGGLDASFMACTGTPAVGYSPGMSAVSASGAYRATITAATSVDSSGATIPTVGIGHTTFSLTVGAAGDGGAAPDGPTMSIPAVPGDVPADPYMPVHKHGGSTIPLVAAQGPDTFSVSGIDFFMGGYWELYLDLQAPGATAKDRVTFSICVPSD
jgi:hypothetical protein